VAATPFDTASYLNQRRSINSQAQTAQDRLQYDRQQFEAMRRLADQNYESGWANQRTQVPRGMGRRNMLNSGVYGRALSSFFANKLASDFQRQAGLSQQMADFDWRGTDIEQQRSAALVQLEAERQARRAQIAATLQQMRSN
jgi:hypothetical protein